MEMTSYAPGTPSWVDLGTPDAAGASAFYSGLFGWDIQEGPPEAGGYRICMLKGQPVAGLGPQMNTDIPPFWASYVSVTDADEATAKARAGGATVFVEPMDVLTVGRMAVFADPAGAAISVWQPRDMPGAGLCNEPGTFAWNELMTRDVPGAIEFYGGVFGWGAETVGDGSYTEWKLDGRSVGGMLAMPAEMPAEMPPMWTVYFAVDDADAAVARVTELGGSVMRPPMTIEPGRFAVVADPYGAVFNVMKLSAALAG
jgi:predicted enzyme related to lactoylglutathione lyase